MNTILINGKEYPIKYGIRAMLIQEQITQKPFSLDNMNEQLVFLYSCLLSADNELTLSYDEFLNEIDNDMSIIIRFGEYLAEQQKKEKNILKDKGTKKRKGKTFNDHRNLHNFSCSVGIKSIRCS